MGEKVFFRSRKGGEGTKEEPAPPEEGLGEEGAPLQEMRNEYEQLYGPTP